MQTTLLLFDGCTTLKQKPSGTKAYEQTSAKEKFFISNHIFLNATKFDVSVDEDQERHHILSKLHKQLYKTRFIANSSSHTTTELSKLLNFCVTNNKSYC